MNVFVEAVAGREFFFRQALYKRHCGHSAAKIRNPQDHPIPEILDSGLRRNDDWICGSNGSSREAILNPVAMNRRSYRSTNVKEKFAACDRYYGEGGLFEQFQPVPDRCVGARLQVQQAANVCGGDEVRGFFL
jgi:hypothetical protein